MHAKFQPISLVPGVVRDIFCEFRMDLNVSDWDSASWTEICLPGLVVGCLDPDFLDLEMILKNWIGISGSLIVI